MEALLVVLVILMSVILITLVLGLVLYLRRLDEATREMVSTLRAVRENMVPLADDTRQTLANVDGLVGELRKEVAQIRHITTSVENLVEGRTIVEGAERAVTSSRATLVSVLEGIKQGLKALRSPKKESKEESDNG